MNNALGLNYTLYHMKTFAVCIFFCDIFFSSAGYKDKEKGKEGRKTIHGKKSPVCNCIRSIYYWYIDIDHASKEGS